VQQFDINQYFANSPMKPRVSRGSRLMKNPCPPAA